MRSTLALAAATALLATGCSALSDDSGESGDVVVAAGFYPLAYVAERVAASTPAEVTLLTQPGAEAHDLELDVQATAVISEADLVVFEQGFQPAVDEAVEQSATGETLDAAAVVDLLAVTESEEEHAEHAEDPGHEDADHEDGEDHETGEEHAEEDAHDHGDEDPHFWHDPRRMAELGDAVADRLAEVDPDHAATYQDNAAALRADLEALDQELADGLAACERDVVVVSHDAFGYLEKYGIHLEPIVGLTPDSEPSPAHRAELEELVRAEGITTVFAERLGSYENSESLAGDLGLTVGVLDPIEGLTTETSGEDYVSLMQANLEALRTANGCR